MLAVGVGSGLGSRGFSALGPFAISVFGASGGGRLAEVENTAMRSFNLYLLQLREHIEA